MITDPIESDDYLLFNLNNQQLVDQIKLDLEPAQSKLIPSTIRGKLHPSHCISDCIEIPYDSYIANGLKQIIHSVNNNKWEFSCVGDWRRLTLLSYSKEGHHLGWHPDFPECVLSIVLCLSNTEDYTGADFELKERDETVKSFHMGYGDCIVFRTGVHPLIHRVTPLKTGIRQSITGQLLRT